jgi:hypothetical protein
MELNITLGVIARNAVDRSIVYQIECRHGRLICEMQTMLKKRLEIVGSIEKPSDLKFAGKLCGLSRMSDSEYSNNGYSGGPNSVLLVRSVPQHLRSEGEYVNIVVVSMLAHRLSRQTRAVMLKEIARVLRTNGICIVVDYTRPKSFWGFLRWITHTCFNWHGLKTNSVDKFVTEATAAEFTVLQRDEGDCGFIEIVTLKRRPQPPGLFVARERQPFSQTANTSPLQIRVRKT